MCVPENTTWKNRKTTAEIVASLYVRGEKMSEHTHFAAGYFFRLYRVFRGPP
jgi:hypothetical protein